MSERTPRLSDQELEVALGDVAAHLAYPPTADLSARVRARIAAGNGIEKGPAFWPQRIALVPVLITLALIALVTLALQPVGSQAAEALGLRGLVIFRTAATPSPTATAPAATPMPPHGGALVNAHRVASVQDAAREGGFAVLLPSALGTPDEVYVGEVQQHTQVYLVYSPRDATGTTPAIPASGQTGIGLLITEVRGSFEVAVLGKLAGPGTKVEQVSVNGAPGFWVEGLHQVFYRGPNGEFVPDNLRLSGNALIWNTGELFVRLEADLPRDQALQIASSMQ
jgi:hypothetical protein